MIKSRTQGGFCCVKSVLSMADDECDFGAGVLIGADRNCINQRHGRAVRLASLTS